LAVEFTRRCMDQQTEQEIVSQNDRMLAMFAHLSMFFGSIWIPLIFWAIYKDKSRFVSFHSLQALFFHLAYTAIIVVMVIFVAVVGVLAGLIKPESSGPPEMGAIQIIVILALGVIVMGFVFVCVALAIINAISSYKGGMKKYPIVGNMVYKRIYGVN